MNQPNEAALLLQRLNGQNEEYRRFLRSLEADLTRLEDVTFHLCTRRQEIDLNDAPACPNALEACGDVAPLLRAMCENILLRAAVRRCGESLEALEASALALHDLLSVERVR